MTDRQLVGGLELHDEARAHSRSPAAGGDPTAVQLHQALADRETKAQAARSRRSIRRLCERLKQARSEIGLEAYAGVADLDVQGTLADGGVVPGPNLQR